MEREAQVGQGHCPGGRQSPDRSPKRQCSAGGGGAMRVMPRREGKDMDAEARAGARGGGGSGRQGAVEEAPIAGGKGGDAGGAAAGGGGHVGGAAASHDGAAREVEAAGLKQRVREYEDREVRRGEEMRVKDGQLKALFQAKASMLTQLELKEETLQNTDAALQRIQRTLASEAVGAAELVVII